MFSKRPSPHMISGPCSKWRQCCSCLIDSRVRHVLSNMCRELQRTNFEYPSVSYFSHVTWNLVNYFENSMGEHRYIHRQRDHIYRRPPCTVFRSTTGSRPEFEAAKNTQYSSHSNAYCYISLTAGPSCRAVYSVGLWPFACWDCGFELRLGHGCLSIVSVVC